MAGTGQRVDVAIPMSSCEMDLQTSTGRWAVLETKLRLGCVLNSEEVVSSGDDERHDEIRRPVLRGDSGCGFELRTSAS